MRWHFRANLSRAATDAHPASKGLVAAGFARERLLTGPPSPAAEPRVRTYVQ
jgi:hypothetical protein